jgi:hypothetical protein
LGQSTSTLEEILNKSLYHGGSLPMIDGEIALADKPHPNNWYRGQLFASEDYKQAIAYLLKSSENSIYSVKSALKKEDVIDLRHNANTISSQQPYIFAQLLKDIESGKIELQEHQSKRYVLETLIGQEGGRYPHAISGGALRDNPFQLYIRNPSAWLAEHGIKAIVHRQGTRVRIPEIGTSVADNPTRTQHFSEPGTDAIAYTTVKDSIAEIEKHSISSRIVKELIARIEASKSDIKSSKIESEIAALLRDSKKIPHKAMGGYIDIPKFKNGVNVVPKDMLAMIHKNESIIPATMNPFNPEATMPKYNFNRSSFNVRGDGAIGASYTVNQNIYASDGMDVEALSNMIVKKAEVVIGQKAKINVKMVGQGKNI